MIYYCDRQNNNGEKEEITFWELHFIIILPFPETSRLVQTFKSKSFSSQCSINSYTVWIDPGYVSKITLPKERQISKLKNWIRSIRCVTWISNQGSLGNFKILLVLSITTLIRFMRLWLQNAMPLGSVVQAVTCATASQFQSYSRQVGQSCLPPSCLPENLHPTHGTVRLLL